MGVFHAFKIVQMVPNRVKHHIKPVSSSTLTVYQDKISQKEPLSGVLKNS